jgi:hypothetical protein
MHIRLDNEIERTEAGAAGANLPSGVSLTPGHGSAASIRSKYKNSCRLPTENPAGTSTKQLSRFNLMTGTKAAAALACSDEYP